MEADADDMVHSVIGHWLWVDDLMIQTGLN
jgi:hypothetical protein